MTQFISVAKRKIFKAGNCILWPWYLAKYKRSLSSNEVPSERLLQKLVYHWGNAGWSADTSYLRALFEKLNSSKNLTIVECGSGLTTVLLGLLSDRQEHRIFSLEHHERWREKIVKVLQDNHVANVSVLSCPLKSYGSYDWYEIPSCEGITDTPIDVVICDGPPAQTKGGRLGLPYVLGMQFNRQCSIFLDDSHRIEEKKIIEGWLNNFPMTVDVDRSALNFKVILYNSESGGRIHTDVHRELI